LSARYTEDALVEQPAIELFRSLGWEYVDCMTEVFGKSGMLGRESRQEVVSKRHLHGALSKINPLATEHDITEAIEEITKDRSAMSIEAANREIYLLVRNGVQVNSELDQEKRRILVIDFSQPENNHYLLVSQLWIAGDLYTRRSDLIGFVNGLPLVFIELKRGRVEDAYTHNLADYRDTIPQLFHYNGLVILSNGAESRVGSITAKWEHFGDWKRIESENEEAAISLETMIRGTCDKGRLLDLVENFTLFSEGKYGLQKLLARNHQYIGVNQAVASVEAIRKNEGRLGVFWHTQGSGKSYSMVFFAEKVLRKLPGNWTFVIVTDRTELDEQIHTTFANCGAAPEKEARAESSRGLRALLSGDHRYVFTLIQKFIPNADGTMPVLSERSDIIVITDEAHRSQYDILASNMRRALPNAAFIGFTGTPLMAGEERTREVFGDYISVYNFKQSIDDKATVPLYYENRIPELQLTNEDLNTDMENLLESAELDEDQEKKLEREFSRQYHLITREDRLEKVAEDLVEQFSGRASFGKAMMVCIDKATAVRMYDKVQSHWNAMLVKERLRVAKLDPIELPDAEQKLKYLEATDMAVVVSQGQGEVDELRKKGLNILPHRERLVKEDLDLKFKNPQDPLRIVFVCAMWITGFDVPCCSTIYLDKPMRNHTLMQTIARANRVFPDKVNGLIVDYVGVFRSLQKALAIYAAPGLSSAGEAPVQDKKELLAALRKSMEIATEVCTSLGIELTALEKSEGFMTAQLLAQAAEKILVNDLTKKRFFQTAGQARRLYKAVLPDIEATEFAERSRSLKAVASKVKSLLPPTEISEVMHDIAVLLDDSVSSEGYVISSEVRTVNLATLDFDALTERFKKSKTKRAEIELLKGDIEQVLQKMIAENRTRMDFHERFMKMLEDYNSGAHNTEQIFDELKSFMQDLDEEGKRAYREGLSEEELTIFDLLTKPEMKLDDKEEKEVKLVAKTLLKKLKDHQFVLDWKKRQQTRAAVKNTIEEVLDKLPRTYTPDLWNRKCEQVYMHVFESYQGEGRSVYAQ
jgi:type I restriction enzyme R subunit